MPVIFFKITLPAQARCSQRTTTYFYVQILFFLSLVITSHGTLHSQETRRLYIANDDHTDYMWTANEEQYDSAFVKMLDYYLDQIDATMHNAPDFQARFNCDGSYWLTTYKKYRTPVQFERL